MLWASVWVRTHADMMAIQWAAIQVMVVSLSEQVHCVKGVDDACRYERPHPARGVLRGKGHHGDDDAAHGIGVPAGPRCLDGRLGLALRLAREASDVEQVGPGDLFAIGDLLDGAAHGNERRSYRDELREAPL